MQSKLKFFSMLVIVISMMCIAPTVFGANKIVDKIVLYFDYEKFPANETRTYGELEHDIHSTYPTYASYSSDTISYVDRNHVGLSYKQNGEIIAVPYSKYNNKISSNDELYASYSILPVENYEFKDTEPKIIFNEKELSKSEYVYKNYTDHAFIYIHIPITEGTKIDKVRFKQFDQICDGQQYISNLEIDTSFGVPCSINKQGFLMFNKEITGKASKGEIVGQYAIVKLDDGYYWGDESTASITGTRKTFSQGEKISEREYKFIYSYQIESKKDLLVIHDLPDVIEYKEGEEVKFSIYATSGATKTQWYEVVDTNSKRGTKEYPIEGATDNTLNLGVIDKSYDGKQYVFIASDDTGAIRKSKIFTLKCTGVSENVQTETTTDQSTNQSTLAETSSTKNTEQATQTETPTQQSTEQPATEVKYEVEFESNGGSKVATQEIAEKGKATKPTNPTKEGFTFENWYTDKKLTKVYDFSKEVTDDIILYAKWVEAPKEEQPTEQPTETPTEQPTEKYWSNASEWAVAELDKASDGNLIPWIFEKQDLTVNITRREFAYVAVKLYEKITNIKLVESKENPFTDTEDIEVLKAYNIGITKGTSETTFTPDALITREQMATMMTRALNKAGIDTTVDLSEVNKFADDAQMHDWGRDSIYYMSNIEIIKGVGNNTFNVEGNATREQALLISERSAEKFAK